MSAVIGNPGIVQTQPPTPTPELGANEHQVGGTHYRDLDPNPWDVIMAWELNFLAGNVLKYLVRYKRKEGIESLLKAKHYLEKLIEYENDRR